MLTLNAEIAQALAAMQAGGGAPAAPRGDYMALRANMSAMSELLGNVFDTAEAALTEDFTIAAADGAPLTLRTYKAGEGGNKAALLYIHGGGKIAGTLDDYDPLCASYAVTSGVTVIAVDYRLAPEYAFPTPLEDCYAALVWAANHGDKLGIDPARLGIIGDSGGGGHAAAVALMARDRAGPALAAQFLIYPMLDDRNTRADPRLAPYAIWSYDDNYTGWRCFLGDAVGGDAVPAYAAPARTTDFSNLPPTYIDVGGLDIFRDESLAYAAGLAKAGVPVELHVFPGVPHGGEVFAPQSEIARQIWQVRLGAIGRL